MIVAIFKAKIAKLDGQYGETGGVCVRLRWISTVARDSSRPLMTGWRLRFRHWPDLAHVEAWKNDPEHRKAQELGIHRWYESFSVQITDVIRQYGSAS